MKKTVKVLLVCLIVIAGWNERAQAQIPVVNLVTGIIKKVIIAIDLKVQQLQNKTIALQNAEQQLENDLSFNRLHDISGWLGKEKDLYHDYYQELTTVKTLITDYDEVKSIVSRQRQLLAEYENANAIVHRDKHFSVAELAYIENTYEGIIKESSRNLDELISVVTSFRTQMDDAERLQRVQSISAAMQDNLDHLRQFNQQNMAVSLSRARDEQDRQGVRRLYGLE